MKKNDRGGDRFYHWNFAHRGLHEKDKSVPENSLAAFRAAKEAGYGAELDVQLSKDGQVVVFHDDTLDRVCGEIPAPEGLTNGKGNLKNYTYEELHKMSLCGTRETIPLFTDVLDAFYGGGPLIVELKNVGKDNRELCEKTWEILKGYKGVYCIESFTPVIVHWFRKHAPEVFRGQLAMAVKEYKGEVSKPVGWLLGNGLFDIWTKPDFMAYDMSVERPKYVKHLYKKGEMDICWTSRKAEDQQAGYDGVIFEFYRPELKY